MAADPRSTTTARTMFSDWIHHPHVASGTSVRILATNGTTYVLSSTDGGRSHCLIGYGTRKGTLFTVVGASAPKDGQAQAAA